MKLLVLRFPNHAGPMVQLPMENGLLAPLDYSPQSPIPVQRLLLVHYLYQELLIWFLVFRTNRIMNLSEHIDTKIALFIKN